MQAGEHNVERQPDRRDPTVRGGRANPSEVTLLGLQRAAGNGAVARLLARSGVSVGSVASVASGRSVGSGRAVGSGRVVGSGPSVGSGTVVGSGASSGSGTVVGSGTSSGSIALGTSVRWVRSVASVALGTSVALGRSVGSAPSVDVQRDGPVVVTPAVDPNDLAGTPFAAFHPSLKTALTTKFDKGTFPTLAAALNDLSNEKIAILARIGSRIGDYDPGVWTYITKIRSERGWWITDNWGGWFDLDTSGMLTYLSGSKKWCKDNETTAQKLHGTKDAYREIAGEHPGLHIPIKATSDVHVDYHQPADGRADDGSCTWSKIGWLGHAVDYVGGGGASDTGVAYYSRLRAQVSGAQPTDRVPAANITKAKELLDSVAAKVQQYAAQGGLEGSEFKGDAAMKNDTATMGALSKADSLLNPGLLDPSVDPMPFLYGP